MSDLYYHAERYFRTRHVVKTLSTAHAVELSKTPGNLWPLTIQRQKQELSLIKAGNFDIVDRKSLAYPYLPEALHRLAQPIMKSTPYNLRRFSETPIPRRAINLIKNAIVSLQWKIVVHKDFEDNPERQTRIHAATRALSRPNNSDSWKTFLEQLVEDIIAGGYGTVEPVMTPYYKRPFKLWAVDGSTIRLYPDWTESHPERARYAQMVGLRSEMGLENFRDDELIYIRDNVRTNTPFGLGKLEVSFNSINAFLGVQDMSSRAGSDQIHKTWMWWAKPQSVGHINTVIRHTQNEGEGQSKISFMSGMEKPEVIDVKAVEEDDLLPWWQEFLIRIIAQGFDLTPFALGLEKDVNRNTSEVMSTQDFRSAVVPMAKRVEEGFTIGLFHKVMGWKDLEFKFIGLDDPDTLTKMDIYMKQDALDAVTPDEVREDLGKQPISGGFGRLTRTQRTILVQEAAAKIKGSEGAGVPGGFGGFGGGGIPAPGGMGGPRVPIPGTMFSAKDVAEMKPDKVKGLQQMNLLPQTPDLKKKMEENQPGIFEELSEELKEFFEYTEKEGKDLQVKPKKPTPANDKEQAHKFKRREKLREDIGQIGSDEFSDEEVIPDWEPEARTSTAVLTKRKKKKK